MDGTEEGVVDLNIDMKAATDSLASDLFGSDDESPADGTATPHPDGGKVDGDEKVVSPAPTERKGVPKSWSAEAAPMWEKLDDATRDIVLKREEDFHKGLETYKGDAAYGKQFRDVVAPYEPFLQQAGITDPVMGVKQLLNAHVQLSNSDENARTEFMKNLIHTYRIDPAKLGVAAADENVDPKYTALEKQVRDLTASQQAERNAKANELRSSINNDVAAFWADTVAHPYADEVAEDMALLLANPKLSLQDAYERAVRANPATWAKEETRLREETEKKLRAEAKVKADAAKKSRGTVVTNAGEKASTVPVGSIDDTMRETYAKIANRT